MLFRSRVLEVLAQCLATTAEDRVTLSEIATIFSARHASDFARPITNRYIGSLLHRRLHIFTWKSHGTYAVPVSEREKVAVLCKRYGIEPPSVGDDSKDKSRSDIWGHGDVGTNETGINVSSDQSLAPIDPSMVNVSRSPSSHPHVPTSTRLT